MQKQVFLDALEKSHPLQNRVSRLFGERVVTPLEKAFWCFSLYLLYGNRQKSPKKVLGCTQKRTP